MAGYTPDRAHSVWIDFDPQAGHEQSKRRPALVLSPLDYNSKAGLAIVCPITNKAKGYPFEVALPAGLAVTGVILTDQVKSLDWRVRRADYICDVPDAVVQEVLDRIFALCTG